MKYWLWPVAALSGLLVMTGCSPRVQVEAPDKPITINLNVKIQHEVLVKLDRQIDTLLDKNSDLF